MLAGLLSVYAKLNHPSGMVMPLVCDDVRRFVRNVKKFPLIGITIGFVGFVCMALGGLLLLHLSEAKRHELKLAGAASINLTQAMGQQAEDTFDSADLVLDSLIDWINGYGYDAQQKIRLHDMLARRTQALKQIHGFFFFDAQGTGVVSSFADNPFDMTVSDRDYFKYHQRHASLAPHIGAAIHSKENGEWVIPFSRRINDARGQFKGVVLAAIKMQYFNDFFNGFNIDVDGAMFMALSNGILLVRRPSVESFIGVSLADGQVFRDYLSHSSSGNARITSKLDGQIRIFGYKKLSKYGLVVAGSNSERSILREWYHTAYRTSLITGGVVIIICMFGFLIIVQVRNSVRVQDNLRKAQDALQQLATHDSLTGLANRRLFERSFELELKRCARHKRPFSLIMMDIDFFKSYNDSYGHVAGDQCLVAVAEIIQASVRRPSDLAVRYGGEEFSLLLPETDALGTLTLAEHIRKSIMASTITHSGNPLGRLTISLGCYTFIPEGGEVMAQVVEKADAALYQAKKTGRNQTHVFNANDEPAVLA